MSYVVRHDQLMSCAVLTRQISLEYYNLCCVDGYSANNSELYVTQQDAIHEV
jgi:hypothetical protein